MSGLSSEKACNSAAYPYALQSDSTTQKTKFHINNTHQIQSVVMNIEKKVDIKTNLSLEEP